MDDKSVEAAQAKNRDKRTDKCGQNLAEGVRIRREQANPSQPGSGNLAGSSQ